MSNVVTVIPVLIALSARAAIVHRLPDLERREGIEPDARDQGSERVTKVYDGDVLAVDDVSLEAADGEFIVLVGPSRAAASRRCCG